jgi:hypothetical protein
VICIRHGRPEATREVPLKNKRNNSQTSVVE